MVVVTENNEEIVLDNYNGIMEKLSEVSITEEITLPLLIKESYSKDFIKTDIKRIKYIVGTDSEGVRHGLLLSLYKILKSNRDEKRFNIYGELDKLNLHLGMGREPLVDYNFIQDILNTSLEELNDLKQLVLNYSAKHMIDFPTNYTSIIKNTYVEFGGSKYLLPSTVREVADNVGNYERLQYLNLINRKIEIVQETKLYVESYYDDTGFKVFPDGEIYLSV